MTCQALAPVRCCSLTEIGVKLTPHMERIDVAMLESQIAEFAYASIRQLNAFGPLNGQEVATLVMKNNDRLKQQLKEMLPALSPAERELAGSFQKFIERQTAAGIPRERAYRIARNLHRAGANYRAGQRRAAFKVITSN